MRSVCFRRNARAIGGSLVADSSPASFPLFAASGFSSNFFSSGHGMGELPVPHIQGNWSATLIPPPQSFHIPPKLEQAICGSAVRASSASPATESPSVSFHTPCSTQSLVSGPDTKDNRIPHILSIARTIPSRILRKNAFFPPLVDCFRFLAEQREPGKATQASSVLIGEICLFSLVLCLVFRAQIWEFVHTCPMRLVWALASWRMSR